MELIAPSWEIVEQSSYDLKGVFQQIEKIGRISHKSEDTITEETALVAVEHELQVSSRRLGIFYRFKKRISLACYKLFIKAPKELGKQLGFYRD